MILQVGLRVLRFSSRMLNLVQLLSVGATVGAGKTLTLVLNVFLNPSNGSFGSM